jgi:hypothetical protein
VDGDIAALFDAGFLHVERSFPVVIEVAKQLLLLRSVVS